MKLIFYCILYFCRLFVSYMCCNLSVAQTTNKNCWNFFWQFSPNFISCLSFQCVYHSSYFRLSMLSWIQRHWRDQFRRRLRNFGWSMRRVLFRRWKRRWWRSIWANIWSCRRRWDVRFVPLFCSTLAVWIRSFHACNLPYYFRR